MWPPRNVHGAGDVRWTHVCLRLLKHLRCISDSLERPCFCTKFYVCVLLDTLPQILAQVASIRRTSKLWKFDCHSLEKAERKNRQEVHWKWGTSVGTTPRHEHQQQVTKGYLYGNEREIQLLILNGWNWIEGVKLGQEAQLTRLKLEPNRDSVNSSINRVNIEYTSRFLQLLRGWLDQPCVQNTWGTWWIMPLYRIQVGSAAAVPHLNEIYNSKPRHDKMDCRTGVWRYILGEWGIT